MEILGIDIGGANLKFATSNGWTHHIPFPLWKSPEKLAATIQAHVASEKHFERVAVTMTGELCDCFASKQDGVRHIVESVVDVFPPTRISIFQTTGSFVDPVKAIREWSKSAASNWRATAGWAALNAEEESFILVDIGSTTIDLIPVVDRCVVAKGWTDQTRLAASELLYLGMERTPLCSLNSEVTFRNRECSIAREFFATTRDVGILLGDLEENADDLNSADGKPNTKLDSFRRIARMICCDETEMTYSEGIELAEQYFDFMALLIGKAISKLVSENPSCRQKFISLGYGDRLLRAGMNKAGIEATISSFAESAPTSFARCAPAYAVAKLLQRELT